MLEENRVTISTTTNRVDVLGNGSATVFSFAPMVIFEASDLQVWLRDAAGNETLLTQGGGSVNYSVTPVPSFPGFGFVTYPAVAGAPIPTGSSLAIKRVVPLIQDVALENQGAYFPKVQEGALDYLTAIDQQQQEQLNRTITTAASDPSTQLVLPTAVQRAGQMLGFDGAGNPIAAQPASAPVSTAMAGVVAASTVQNGVNALLGGGLVLPAVTQPQTGNFFVEDGGIVNRMNDRLFLGAATLADGGYPNGGTKDWLSTISDLGWATSIAQLVALSGKGLMGAAFGSRTSDPVPAVVGGGGGCIAMAAWAVNDLVSGSATPLAWAGYFEARHYRHNNGACTAIEVDGVGLNGGSFIGTPYAPGQPAGTYGVWVASGGGVTGAGTSTIGVAFINNLSTWNTGICFGKDSITGSDGTVGGGTFSEAISAAYGHAYRWYQPDNSQGPFISSLATTLGRMGLIFADAGVQIFHQDTTRTYLRVPKADPGAAATCLQLLVSNAAGVNLVAVTLGAADSGGSGFKTLRVPN